VGPTASLENALNALPSISARGGSVSVTGGPGDETGSRPYEIAFDGGPLSRTDPAPLIGSSGTTPLSGGSGPGADTAAVSTRTPGGPNGTSNQDTPVDVAVGPGDQVFVAKNYPPSAATCADDSSAPAETRILGLSPSGTVEEITVPCGGLGLAELGGGNDISPQLAVNSATGNLYLLAGNSVFIIGEIGGPPTLALNPVSNLSPRGATISGDINPNGVGINGVVPIPANTTYRVEYKKSSDSRWELYAPDVAVGSGGSPIPFNVGVSALTPNTSYDVRVIVVKPFGGGRVVDTQTFTTLPAPPTIDALSSSNVSATSADLHAKVNAQGTASTYHFEYGTTPAYGQSTPETPLGSSLDPVRVSAHIEGLDPVVYHFRVVATNALGTTTSINQTFTFYPEPCPNSAVRQQTGSAHLPDCRAYELVSPTDAGSVLLAAGGPNSPLASNPSRFAYAGAFDTIPGPWNPPNVWQDLYVATRTNSGWQSAYVGIPGEEQSLPGGPPNRGTTVPGKASDLRMERFLDWHSGHQSFACCGLEGSFAPYMWDPRGQSLGRLPTNLAEIPGAEADLIDGGFAGDTLPSPDFSHYFFSSDNTAFAPGGLTSGPGSVYDNEIAADTVTIASKLGDGSPIPAEPGVSEDHYLNVPVASTDGSHLLIAAPASCVGKARWFDSCPLNPSHLYMRVDGSLTYDVSRGAAVNYAGMSADGESVYFTTDRPLTGTGEDKDTSIDLFRWDEDGDTLTRLSAGAGGVGDFDACNPSWTAKCGVQVVPTNGAFLDGQKGSYDASIASEAGDVYFYSPEQFVGSEGIPGRRNLYVHRGGGIQYVATLDADKPLNRINVSPDGRHAAFITATKLTTYDNAGLREMYSYDPASGELLCVSCLPSGEPPTDDVDGSVNGLFMANDGRTFFSTEDPLVPPDTNGINDVYEYVDGRPQLISSGIAASDDGKAGGQAGLVGVSADGVDAYFSTLEALVSGDQNGQALRFYDARTNGGFPVPPPTIPCAAAEECHGPPSSQPPPLLRASGVNLGAAGNARPAQKPKSTRKRCGKRTKRAGKRAKRCRVAKRGARARVRE
jgi:hypothetical protein